jgi:predicted metalloprotease with PDZ domain
MRWPRLDPGRRVVVIPRAIPVGYGEQPFDRFVENVRAFAPHGETLAVSREDGPRWTFGKDATVVSRVEYDVDIHQMEQEIPSSSDTSKVRSGYLSVLGYSIFAYIEGFEDWDVALEVKVPGDWPVLTTLAPAAPPPRGTTSGRAVDFYELADSQIVAGPDLSVHRLKGPIPPFLALCAEGETDADEPTISSTPGFPSGRTAKGTTLSAGSSRRSWMQSGSVRASPNAPPSRPWPMRFRRTTVARIARSCIQMRFRSSIESAPFFIQQMSTVELSRVASTRYAEHSRTGRNVFSRGGLMAAKMDTLIREKTDGRRRLRDALRHLMAWSRSNERPFEIEELPSIFEEATGVDTRPIMDRWLEYSRGK